MSKRVVRSMGWLDGFNGIDPRQTGEVYRKEYAEGQATRQAAHERLNRVCADARRMQENERARLAKAGPARARFMGEMRELIGVNGKT